MEFENPGRAAGRYNSRSDFGAGLLDLKTLIELINSN